MPLCYFNVDNDDTTIDEEVRNGPTATPPAPAVKQARSLASDTVLRGHLVGSHRIEIVDKDQKPVDSVRFDEAIEIRALACLS